MFLGFATTASGTAAVLRAEQPFSPRPQKSAGLACSTGLQGTTDPPAALRFTTRDAAQDHPYLWSNHSRERVEEPSAQFG